MRWGRYVMAVAALVSFCGIAAGQTVYITKTGTKYHSAGCTSLRSSSTAVSLAQAKAKGLTACKLCDPPTGEAQSPPTGSARPTPTPTSVPQRQAPASSRCQATTKKGTQCSRQAKPGSSYCWQHGG